MCRYFLPKIEHPIFEWIAKPFSGPISGGGWFIDIYVLLMLSSPLLNKLLSVLNRHDYRIGLGILLLLMLVMAFYFINILTLPDTVFYISYYSIILEMGYKNITKELYCIT